MRSLGLTPSFILLLGLIGCSGPTRTFDVSVKNSLDEPITVWLTKNGPPAEGVWLSPEQIATAENPPPGRISGRAVAAGAIADTGPVKGQFPDGTNAVLRIYLGQHTLDELLAMSRRDPGRLDVILSPGKNDIIVGRRDGKLSAEPADGRL